MNHPPIAISGADGYAIHRLDAVGKDRIRGRAPLAWTQSFAKQTIVAASNTVKVPAALASAHDPKHNKQREITSQNRQPNARMGHLQVTCSAR